MVWFVIYLVLGVIMNKLIKDIVLCLRLYNYLVVDIGFLFLSGYFNVSILLYFVLMIIIILVVVKIIIKVLSVLVMGILWFSILFCCFYFYVYYFLDVIGGMLLVIIWVVLFLMVYLYFINY